LDPDELTWTVADLLEPMVGGVLPEIEQGVIRPSSVDGLDILPADVRLASVERFLYDRQNYEQGLAQILAIWRERYDYILLDCPPSLGAITLMALTAAHRALIPVQCEYYAARGLKRLLEIISAIRERTNPALAVHMLATMYDQRNGICRSVLAQLQDHFPNQLFDTVIRVDTRLRESPAAGEPIIHFAPRSRASKQYRQLAQEFSSRINLQEV
jgi:chromosome partitioning protein